MAHARVLSCCRVCVLAVVLSCVGDIVHACVRRCVLDLRWKLEAAGRYSRYNAQHVHAQLHGQHAGARPASTTESMAMSPVKLEPASPTKLTLATPLGRLTCKTRGRFQAHNCAKLRTAATGGAAMRGSRACGRVAAAVGRALACVKLSP